MTSVDTAETSRGRPRWSYQGSPHVGGAPKAELVYLLALLIAAGADAVAFHQVVQIVMPYEQGATPWILVAGLTVIALTLAHLGGRLARDGAAATGRLAWKDVAIVGVIWVLLGAAGFTVRLLNPVASGAVSLQRGHHSGGISSSTFASALLFLFLYAASGLVAAVGEFMSRNPLRTAYRNALRAHSKALRRLTRSQPPYQRALHVRELHRKSLVEDRASLDAAIRARIAFGEELKRGAAETIAEHLQDPSATDGMTERDWRPMAGPLRPEHRPRSAEPNRPHLRSVDPPDDGPTSHDNPKAS